MTQREEVNDPNIHGDARAMINNDLGGKIHAAMSGMRSQVSTITHLL